MTIVLFYFILGFVGHFLILFVNENELEEFKRSSMDEKLGFLLLNTALGIFTFIFAAISLLYEIYLIEKTNYKEKQSTKNYLNEEDNSPDASEHHANSTRYL